MAVTTRGLVISTEIEMVTEECCNCHMVFAMTKEFKQQCRNAPKVKKFYCPAGHQQWYVDETEADILRRERDRLKQQTAYLEDSRRRAMEEAEHQRHRANGYKGHATRITKRAKAGLCPCCNRTFSQLARHMATQHPTFTPDVPEPPKLAIVK